jgi:glycosyltransferase involved in cell wall biosynthesis
MKSSESYYVALPNTKAPRICFDVSVSESIESAFFLYRPHSVKGKLLKLIGKIAAFSGLLHLIGRLRLEKEAARELNEYKTHIKDTLNLKDIQVAFLKGTSGKHQKWIAIVTNKKKIVGYAKIACATTAVSQLRIEADCLKEASRFESQNISIPRLLASKFSDDISLIVISAPEDESKDDAPKLLNDSLVMFITNMISRGGVSECSLDRILDKEFYLSGNSRIELIRRRLNNWLPSLFAGNIYLCTCAHGDFAPWNVIGKKNNNYFVFDWEYASADAPALFDIFHYIFMPAMLVEKVAPATSIKYCLEICDENNLILSLAKTLSIDEQKIPGYLAMYLWCMLMRLSDTQNSLEKSTLEPAVEYIVRALDSLCYQFNRRLGKPKVLVSAYACDPEHGSEPGVGWQMVQAISKSADTWVVTRKNNREPIENELRKTNNLHVYISDIDLPKWLGWWKRGQRGVRTYYYLWQFVALHHYRKELKQLNFNLAHHITFVNDWIFSFLAFTGLNFIWGPIGSCPKMPRLTSEDLFFLIKDRLRYSFQSVVRTLDPLYWLTASRASLIIGITAEVSSRMPLRIFKDKAISYPAIGVEDLMPVYKKTQSKITDPFLVSVGNFVPIKQFHLVFKSFALVLKDFPNARLTVVGKGALKSELVSLVRNLKIENSIQFCDWMPREEVLSLLAEADIFVFPSAEASGMVVLEAMVQATPVVCLDYAGPSELLGEGMNMKVSVVGSQEKIVEGLSEKICLLLTQPELREKYSHKLRDRAVNSYSWANRNQIIEQWYSNVCNN